MGTVPAVVSIPIFISGMVAVFAVGDAIKLRTGTWAPTFLLMLCYMLVSIILVVFAATKLNGERQEGYEARDTSEAMGRSTPPPSASGTRGMQGIRAGTR